MEAPKTSNREGQRQQEPLANQHKDRPTKMPFPGSDSKPSAFFPLIRRTKLQKLNLLDTHTQKQIASKIRASLFPQ